MFPKILRLQCLQSLMVNLPFVKLHASASTPRCGSLDAAGLDLAAGHDTYVFSHGKALVSTGLAFAIPVGHYGRIAPRSGFSYRNHADIGAGVIDQDYRGEVKVLIFNHSNDTIVIKKGERVAQLILEKCSQATPRQVEQLPPTKRGINGFGSSGLN